MAVFSAAATSFLIVMALLAPAASAATSSAALNSAALPVRHISGKIIFPPFPDCGDSFTVTRLGSKSKTVRVVGVDLNYYLKATKKVWITDTADSTVYGPYYVTSSLNRDIVTDSTSPTTFAIELTTEENETLCAGDYYA